jgi:hypothetical protein
VGATRIFHDCKAISSRAGKLPATHPVDGEPIRPGRIYVAPPAYHLVLEVDRVRLTKGPKKIAFVQPSILCSDLPPMRLGRESSGSSSRERLTTAPPGYGRSRIAVASPLFRTRRRLRIRRCRRAPSSTLKSITVFG